jgi:hypothetical protein
MPRAGLPVGIRLRRETDGRRMTRHGDPLLEPEGSCVPAIYGAEIVGQPPTTKDLAVRAKLVVDCTTIKC